MPYVEEYGEEYGSKDPLEEKLLLTTRDVPNLLNPQGSSNLFSPSPDARVVSVDLGRLDARTVTAEIIATMNFIEFGCFSR